MDPTYDWRVAVRAHRKARAWSQASLASRAGVAVGTVRAYETGGRRPSREGLARIIDALGIPTDEANRIRATLGYASDRIPVPASPGRFTLEELEREVHVYPWPVFITNQAVDLVCTNKVAERVWGVDLATEFTGPGERNLLAVGSSERFASQAVNWGELVGLMISLAKGDPRGPDVTLDQPHPWIERAVQTFMQGDPKFIAPFMRLWEDTPPLPNRTRHHYSIRWRHGGAEPLRFLGVMNTVDVVEEWTWNDWIPADGETWSAMNAIAREKST